MSKKKDELVTILAWCEAHNVKPRTAYLWAKNGELPVKPVPTRKRITIEKTVDILYLPLNATRIKSGK